MTTECSKRLPKPRSLGQICPTPQEVKKARLTAGCTAREAAIMVHIATNAWINFERPLTGDKLKDRRMHPALAELFAIKTGLHPIYGPKQKPSEEG